MRVALGISYNGTVYEGWQSQLSRLTIQDKLEAALAKFTQSKISTLCAGRTDSGVHGLMQVVHFDTDTDRETNSWVRGLNASLPTDIAVQWAKIVPPSFHCRASALTRRYAYVVLESAVRPSVETNRVGWVYRSLDEARMKSAAAMLNGEHDFSSFRAAACQALSPIKTMKRIDISFRGEPLQRYWRFEFEANAFLHHMIRNIMGCLLMVGDGRQSPEWILDVLAKRDRDAAAPTFSPYGLYFLGPTYSPEWGIPDRTAAFDWLP